MRDNTLRVAAQLAALLVGICLALTACNPAAGTTADSDSGYLYKNKDSAKIPLDDAIYTLTGVVVGDVRGVTRQGPTTAKVTITEGVTTGTFFTPEMTGKGMVRLWIEKSDYWNAPAESIVILKTTDTKAAALLNGDRVTFKCRAQAEAIAPSYTDQPYDVTELPITWELDFCRMSTARVEAGSGPAKSWTGGQP